MKHTPTPRAPVRRRRAAYILALSGLALSACGEPFDPGLACTEQFVYGLTVEVVDATSGAQRAAGSTLTVRDGAWEEVVTEVMGVNSLIAAGERAGKYAVTVTRDGYETWTRFDVEVDEDECHVIPVTLLAELEPTP